MIESSQVTNHEVSISFFEKTIEDISSASDVSSARMHSTRADNKTTLAACHRFSELEVALIPIDSENDSGYVVRQDSLGDDFGKVTFDVPEGTYHMVAVAAVTPMPLDKRISIKSATEVRFPNDQVTDMVYAYKDITVSAQVSNQNFDATLSRGVSAFVLRSSIETPLNVAGESIDISGDCGVVFNPATGTCKTEAPIHYERVFDAKKYKYNHLFFTVYTLLKADDVENLHVKSQAKDKKGKVIKESNFDNVHLVKGKLTRYEGNFFNNSSTTSFTVSNTELDESKYSKTF